MIYGMAKTVMTEEPLCAGDQCRTKTRREQGHPDDEPCEPCKPFVVSTWPIGWVVAISPTVSQTPSLSGCDCDCAAVSKRQPRDQYRHYLLGGSPRVDRTKAVAVDEPQ